jgi:hypothetical protein
MILKGIAGIGVALIIVSISVGALLGALFLPRIFGSHRIPVVGAPDDHWAIIENMDIIEVGLEGEHFTLEPLCVDYGKKEFSKEWPISLFHEGELYPQSTWLFQRWGDTEVCLTIWGPAEDQGYDLEASRLVGFQKIEIWYDHELIRTMPRVTQDDLYTCMPGYVWFTLSLE